MSKNTIIKGGWAIILLMFFEVWLYAMLHKWNFDDMIEANFYIAWLVWFFLAPWVLVEDWNKKR